ncbi:hypothetical protein ACJ41O_008438 [Fusarium nematophilum]
MRVYGTCEWGTYPDCDAQDECPNRLGDLSKNWWTAKSASGSGGGRYDAKENPLGLNIPGNQFRKDVGLVPDVYPRGFCRSGCPPDRVRVAIDTEIDTCSIAGIGGMAICCKASFSDEIEIENPKLDAYRSAMREIWDSYIEEHFPYLTCRHIKAVLNVTAQWEVDGTEETARRIICSPHSYNARVAAIQGTNGGGRAKWINCTYAVCDEKGVYKGTPDEVTRRRRAMLPGRSTHLSAHHHRWLHARQVSVPEEWQTEVTSPGGREAVIEYDVAANNPPADFNSRHESLRNTAEWMDPIDCSEYRLMPGGGVWTPARIGFYTEHPVDKSLMKRFFVAAGLGKLESGRKSAYGPVPIEFFEEIMTLGADDQSWPTIPGNPGFDSGNLFTRIMEYLGSQTNDRNFVIADATLNLIKGQLMQLHNPIAPGQWKDKIADDIEYVLGVLRACAGLFEYMNSAESPGPNTFGKTSNIINDVMYQMSHAEVLWGRAHPGVKAVLAPFFVEWLADYYDEVSKHTIGFLQKIIPEVRAYWGQRSGDDAFFAMETVKYLEPHIRHFRIRTDWEINLFAPDDPMDEDSEDGDTEMSG